MGSLARRRVHARSIDRALDTFCITPGASSERDHRHLQNHVQEENDDHDEQRA